VPYYHKDLKKMRELIATAKMPKFPRFLNAPSIQLMKGLLQRDGAKRPSATEARQSTFFKETNWRKVPIGLGRSVALYHRSSTLYKIH
jgi:hypothetical protein